MTLFIISFVAGVLTVLAPCILPLLPVIVGRSISDPSLSRRRVFVIILALGVSVILFTLILKASTLLISIPQDFWKYISGGIIFVFGLITLFPSLWENLPFTSLLNRKSNQALMQGYQKNSVFGDVIVGASLGPIFSACSPTYFVILATVLPVDPVAGVLYLLVYAFGLCLALFIAAILGQKLMARLNIVSDPRGWFKRILGIIFILVGIGIFTGYDKKLQVSLLDAGFFDVTKIEQSLLDENESGDVISENKQNQESPAGLSTRSQEPTSTKLSAKDQPADFPTLGEKQKKLILAPDLSTIDGYINTENKPITVSEFKGKKVVLLDIWTYSCINCQRTIPYLNEWYKKYAEAGLVIVGLHTPEFAFERIQKNVEKAVQDFKIKYPVVLDNDFSTWNAYQNRYWPRKYLIDIDGYIVYDHAGEGQYAETEKAIQKALAEKNLRLGLASNMPTDMADPADKMVVFSGQIGSPEIYFGSARNEHLSNGTLGVPGPQTLVVPVDIASNDLYLGGIWNFEHEFASNAGDGNVVFKYKAKNVYMVAASKAGADVEVYVDGKLISTIFVQAEKLYDIVKGADYAEHTLELKIKKPGVEIYTFTFG